MDVELQHKDDKDTSKVVQQRRWRKVSIGEKFATVLVVFFHSLPIQVGMKRVVMFNAALNYRIKIGKIPESCGWPARTMQNYFLIRY